MWQMNPRFKQCQFSNSRQATVGSAAQHSTAQILPATLLTGWTTNFDLKKYPSKESNPCPLEVRRVELTPRITRELS